MKREFRAEVVNCFSENNVDFTVSTKSVTDKELEFFIQPEIKDWEITALRTPDSMGDDLFLEEFEEEAIDAMQEALDKYKERIKKLNLPLFD